MHGDHPVELLDGKHEVRVTWKPYQLIPWMPPEGMERAEYRRMKFGSAERSSGMDTRLKETGDELGIDLAFERIARRNASAERREPVS